MPENVYSEGYFTGILDIMVALMATADSPSHRPTYDPFEVLGKTIEATITPNYKEGKVYASNVTTRNEKRVDSYTVSLNLDKIPYAMREKVLGRLKDSNGVQILTGDQIAPNVAIAFALTLDDGSKEGHTDSDTMTYQHPTIEGTFVRREYDNALGAVAATADEGVMETVEAGWFTQVYEKVTA